MTDPIILVGDARQIPLPDRSVQCVVTSPPYWGLRDYGTAKWEGGDPNCDHQNHRNGAGRADGIVDDRGQRSRDGAGSIGGDCKRCGAQRVDQQIGLEPTPDAYVETMVQVFREIRRVLRDDGTVWLNLGDSYAAARGGTGMPAETLAGGIGGHGDDDAHRGRGARENGNARRDCTRYGLKHKDLIGIPWRVAFALQADGWYLRSDIIWAKPNPMPESVTDRPTKAHEYIFLLTKSERYYFDHEGSKEPAAQPDRRRADRFGGNKHGGATTKHSDGSVFVGSATRNARSVWTITTKPFKGAHFATFPPEIPERCIKAGTPEGGSCSLCGTPFRRLIERGAPDLAGMVERRTVGWQPQCGCGAPPAPAVVFDPFAGAGTTLVVARALGRASIGLELNAAYAEMARARLDGTPLAKSHDKQAGHGRRHDGFNERYFGSPDRV